MKKEILNKATMYAHKEVDIFCSHKYKGYYIRGTIFSLYDYFQEEKGGRDGVVVSYRFAITALVNAAYLRRVKKLRKEQKWRQWDLYAVTEKEYLEAVRRERLNDLRKTNGPNYYPTEERMEQFTKNRTLLIDLDEADIKESEYLAESIRTKKEVILLNMDFVVDRIGVGSSQVKEGNHFGRIYSIPAFHCPERRVDPNRDFIFFFDKKFEDIYSKLEYDYLGRKEYFTILNSIGKLSYEWIEKNAVSKSYLKRLNRVNRSMGDRTYPLTDFCWKFFDDLVDELTTNKLIGKCPHCRDFFRWPRAVRMKKYCSLKTDGKNCAKAAADHRHYEKGKPETLEKRRKDIRETRALYKRLGIKK